MSRYHNVVLFFALTALWGTSFVAIEVGLEYYSPLLFAAYRFDIAAVLLVGYVLIAERQPFPRTGADGLAILLSGGFSIGINNAALFIGQQYTTSGIAAIVYSLVPITTAAVAAIVLTETSLDRRGAVGILFGFLGVGLVSQPDPANLTSGVTFGVMVILIGVIAVAVGGVGLQRLETSFSNIALTAWALLFSGVFLHVTSVAGGEPQRLPASDPLAIAILVFLGVFASAIAYIIYFTLLDRLGAFQINLISYVFPVITTVTGWALLGESLTGWTIGGFSLIVFGFILVKRAAIRRELPNMRSTIVGWL